MDRRSFMAATAANASAIALCTPNAGAKTTRAHLTFVTDGVPDVPKGSLKVFVVMYVRENKKPYVHVAYYLNEFPLEYEDCECEYEDDHNDDGCPTTGWYEDNSNFEYDNCYRTLDAKVVAWAALPSVDDVRASISKGLW